MPKMVFGTDYTHDFEKKTYEVVSLEDYYRVIKILKDSNLRSLLHIIAHHARSVTAIAKALGKSTMVVQMMLDEIDKQGFLIKEERKYGGGTTTIYQVKYNVFIFDMR